MSAAFDIAVVGAGPAGANAALAAAETGLAVALVDEQPKPGGQVWRAKSDAILDAPSTPETMAGDALRDAVERSALTAMPGTRIWTIEREDSGWLIRGFRDEAVTTLTARALILAPGAREFVQPVPGWTLPGVIGLAGATALIKQHLEPHGQRTVVSGSGPLVFFVASEIRRLGGHVAAVVTPNSRGDWLASFPKMLARPDLLRRGALWVADLMLAGVPIRWRHTVACVHGNDRVDGVDIVRVDAGWAPAGPAESIRADSLCLGHGLIANTEPGWIAGLDIDFRPELGGWTPRAEPDGSTAIEGLYLCGDGAGIRGAAAAEIQGRLAGLAAAIHLGRSGLDDRRHQALGQFAKAERFGLAMTALSRPRRGQLDWTTDDTVVCRCESLTRSTLEAEIEAGAASANALKSGTRGGMGPCGGKYCQTVTARLIAAKTDHREENIAPPTPRPPLRPVPIKAMTAGFAYDDLPIPRPAPL